MTARADAIVVGAGLSGLKAARELAAKGKTVIVLEAQNRVGGRVMGGELRGHAIDHGAQWVGPRHTRLLAEARRFSMETKLQYSDGKTILSLEGQRAEYAGEVPDIPVLGQIELAMLQRRWNRETRTLPESAPWNAPKAKEWDSQTLETWIQKNLSTKASRGFARLIPAAFGAHASEISYLWMLTMLRDTGGFEQLMNVKGGVRDASFKGGAHRLAQRMADDLEIVPSSPVRSITQDEAGVMVKTGAGEFSASRVIVSVPPTPCARIDFNQISPRKRALQERMPPTAMLKFHLAYDQAFWRARGYSRLVVTDSLPLSLVLECADDPPMLIGFAQGENALELSAMSAAQRQQTIVACLVDLFGPDASEPLGYAEMDWLADEWAGGYGSGMAPGVLTNYGEALREACGRIHWAGSEAACEWPGFMEGALESGERAAAEVLARL